MGNINIGGRLHSVASGNVVTGANEIFDDTEGKKQDVINAELHQAITDSRISEVEATIDDNVGTPEVDVTLAGHKLTLAFQNLLGDGIASIEQTTTSEESEGVNVVTVTTVGGKVGTFQIRNGKQGDTTILDPQGVAVYKLYNGTGQNTDGAMTQKAVTDLFEGLNEKEEYDNEDFETGGYYDLTYSSAPQSATSASNFKNFKVKIKQGAIINIVTKGGANGRAYALTYEDLTIYDRAPASADYSAGKEVIAVHDGWLYVNSLSSFTPSVVIKYAIKNTVKNLKEQIESGIELIEGNLSSLENKVEGEIASLNERLDGRIYGIIANYYRHIEDGRLVKLNGRAASKGLIDLVDGCTYTLHADNNNFARVYAFNDDTYLGSIDNNVVSFTTLAAKGKFPTANKFAYYISTGSDDELSQQTVDKWYVDNGLGEIDVLEKEIEDLSASVEEEIEELSESVEEDKSDIASLKKGVQDVDFLLSGRIYGMVANKFRHNEDGRIVNLNGKATNETLIKLNQFATYTLHANGNNFSWVYGFEGDTYLGGFACNASSFTASELLQRYPASTYFAFYLSAGSDPISQSVVDTWYVEGGDSIIEEISSLNDDVNALSQKSSQFTYIKEANALSFIESVFDANNNIVQYLSVKRSVEFPGWGNPCFTFDVTKLKNKSTGVETTVKDSKDDIAPLSIEGVYIGSNHGDSDMRLVTCANHGKTYADIGSIWSDGSHLFTIIGIGDANSLYLLGENNRTYPHFSFYTAAAGTYTHVSGATNTGAITVTAAEVAQLRPALKVTSLKVYADDKEISESGVYGFNELKICEEYDLYNPASILEAIQSNVGTFAANPVTNELEGIDVLVKFSIAYVFKNAYTLVITNTITVMQDTSLAYYGFTQQSVLSGNGRKMYVPKTLPVNVGGSETDFRVIVDYDTLANDVDFTSNKWENPLLPPDRWLQYSNDIGFASGYLFDYGVGGNNRKDCVSNAIWLYASSRKVYTRGIDEGKVSLSKYDSYSAAVFRQFVSRGNINTNGVINITGFEYNGKYYVYGDFNAVGLYEINIPNKFVGKKADVFEKSGNVTLLTKIAASKLIVKVDTSNPLYGYIVLTL